MSDLPEERVTQATPFHYSDMDVFGPFYVKEGRKTLKCYGLIFTCLVSRAVHLETLNTMETDSFISALRRQRLSTDKERYANYVRTKGQISLELGMNSPMPYKNSTMIVLRGSS